MLVRTLRLTAISKASSDILWWRDCAESFKLETFKAAGRRYDNRQSLLVEKPTNQSLPRVCTIELDKGFRPWRLDTAPPVRSGRGGMMITAFSLTSFEAADTAFVVQQSE